MPYNRRRRVEGMLRGAQIEAQWIDAPTPEAIRAKDRTRLIERLTEPREFEEYDRELAADLMARMTPEDIAATLVQTQRAEMPAPEELIANTPEAREQAKAERHRPGFEDVVWFRMSIGRRQNAEPRWLLPLICRRGHITRNEIGAIRIGQHESWFQIPRPVAAKFADTVARTASPEDEQDAIAIEEAPDGPRIEARENRRNHGGGRVEPRPMGRGPGRKPAGKPAASPVASRLSARTSPAVAPVASLRAASHGGASRVQGPAQGQAPRLILPDRCRPGRTAGDQCVMSSGIVTSHSMRRVAPPKMRSVSRVRP